VTASTSEGFGLTLMEAVGSGLAMIGLDVRYGNQTFIEPGQNGYLLEYTGKKDQKQTIERLAKAIVELFTKVDLAKAHQASYALAQEYLTSEVEQKWHQLLGGMTNA
ncbi:MAG: glycosyltransferase, partial [Ligilactobacillus sp.]|nr:glycosyltransferase [Ligilactobacillus sp.]